MLVTIRILLGLTLSAVGSAGVVLAYYLFSGVHFFVKDAVLDQREMQDFQVDSPYWLDLLGYFWFYLPALVVGILGVVFFVGGISVLFRIRNSNSDDQTESTHQLGEQDAAPL